MSEQSVNKTYSRNSAFEILRLIAIVFIIAHHFSVHGGFNFGALEQTTTVITNTIWIDFIGQLGKVGVNLFVLISSFFLIDNTRFRTKKLIALLLEMLVFSLAIGLSFFFYYKKEFSIDWLNTIIFPFGTSVWWYMTAYLILYLLSPLINLGIRAMNKKLHLILTIVCLFIWSFMPTFVLVNYAFSNLGWFITLYLIGSYIKLYGDDFKVKPWVGILLSIGIFISWFAIKTGINYGIPNRHYLLNRFLRVFNLIEMGNSVQVFCTILMFVSFSKINMKSYKWINVLASTTLAIYLLHDHGDTRHFLWLDFFKNASYSSSIYLIPYSIGVILGVFVAGLAIGLIYRYTFGLGFNKLLDLLERKLLYKIDNIVNNQPTENNVQN